MTLTLPSQIAQLHAELEKEHGEKAAKEREMTKLQGRLTHISQQKDYLMRTTEMYEADKRELEQEVRSSYRVGKYGC